MRPKSLPPAAIGAVLIGGACLCLALPATRRWLTHTFGAAPAGLDDGDNIVLPSPIPRETDPAGHDALRV